MDWLINTRPIDCWQSQRTTNATSYLRLSKILIIISYRFDQHKQRILRDEQRKKSKPSTSQGEGRKADDLTQQKNGARGPSSLRRNYINVICLIAR